MHARRGGTHAELLRREEVFRLVQVERMTPLAAYWQVISSPIFGRKKSIGQAERGEQPNPSTLRLEFLKFLRRTQTRVVERAVAEIEQMVSAGAADIAAELVRNATRTVDDRGLANGISAQTKAAELCLKVLGAIRSGGGGVQVGVQVNAGRQEAAREAMREAEEFLVERKALPRRASGDDDEEGDGDSDGDEADATSGADGDGDVLDAVLEDELDEGEEPERAEALYRRGSEERFLAE